MGMDIFKGLFFNAYNVVSTAAYVFDSAGGTAATVGWVPCSGMTNKNILFYLPTLGSTTVHLLIQGRIAGIISQIYQKDYAAVTTYGEEIPITGEYDEIRVGLKVTTNGTDSVSVAYQFARVI